MGLNIVVVDDETPICEWLVYCIRRASPDYRVTAAANGDEAFALITAEKPDLVFTDICMPGMDGLELMRRTLEVLPFTVFAILTNYAEFTYARRAVSLGAKEYFLKSELRAADIEQLLSQTAAAKTAILQAKTKEVYPSGCIDLYKFYQMQGTPHFADQFWAEQGMWADVPYRVLCIPGGNSQEEWRRTARLAQEAGARGGGSVYTAAATEKGHEYLVLQTRERLSEEMERLAAFFTDQGSAGISGVIEKRGDFLEALRQAGTAQASSFFQPEKPVIHYEELATRPPIAREAFFARKREALELIVQRRYAEAEAGVEACLAALSRPGAKDVAWAIDNCRRLALSVEERYDQETESPSQLMTVQTTAVQCGQLCRELIEKLRQLRSGGCSPRIAEALAYIHQHYSQNISMAEAAQTVFLSPEYFSRQFKEEVGENFNAYLTLYRLDRAQELLRRTDLRIAEVAERVGYTTPGYFSRLYKRYKGVTPEKERMSKSC